MLLGRCDTAHGLASALEDRLLVSVRASAVPSDGHDLHTNLLLWACSPLQRSQPGESTSRSRLPGARCHAPAQHRHLVAGFHSRFGPPSPFLTTLTVSASPSPVTYFSHSRPWGSFSLLPACCPTTSRPKTTHDRAQGMGTTRARFRLPDASNSPRRAHLPRRLRFGRRDDRCDSGSPCRPLRPPGHPAACATLRPVSGRPSLSREGVGQSPPQQAATGWRMESRPEVVPARVRRPRAACYRHPTSVPPGTDPCGPACAPGQSASRLPDRSRLPASRPSAPPPVPEDPGGFATVRCRPRGLVCNL